MTYFDPQPRLDELPSRLSSPFSADGPAAISRRAAEAFQAELNRGWPKAVDTFWGEHRGKMFGVLVVADPSGRVGYLRGFSGMLDGTWQVDGCVGPVFDADERDSFWPKGEAELVAYDRRLERIENQIREMSLKISTRGPEPDTTNLERADVREASRRGKRLRAADAQSLRALQREHAVTRASQSALSNSLLALIHAGYQLQSARGQRRTLNDIFAPDTPPGGAGDCAAPKLFAYAQRNGLRPIAVAEFWWGTSTASGDRQHGVFYPSCRGKCGPVLTHMLDGLATDPLPRFGDKPIASDEPRTLFEDSWLSVVVKPVGLPSIAGRHHRSRDAVQTRLRQRYPDATGPLLVRRLDTEASGILLIAKDLDTYAALRRQFSMQMIDQRYVAWLDGIVVGDAGSVCLRVSGKAARTDWRVQDRTTMTTSTGTSSRTRVQLSPRTDHLHQLRVHAADPLGLGCAVVGDGLYGAPQGRLMLHAESVSFTHPNTAQAMTWESPAPF